MLTPFKVTVGDSFLMFLLIPSEQIAEETAAIQAQFKAVVDHTYKTIQLIP